LFVSEACNKFGLNRDELHGITGRKGQIATDVEDNFSKISLFGENREEILKKKVSARDVQSGKFFTRLEREFLMACGRTPAKNKEITSRKRILVRQIILFL
jgi:hypothetical protein